MLLTFAVFPACAGENKKSIQNTQNSIQGENMKVIITIGTKTFTATLEDNETAKAFARQFPLTLNMSELNGNEYYNYLDSSLPAKSSNPKKIETGDIKLYGTSCIVIFYKSFSTSYSYTTLGKISDTTGLEAALKASGGKVTFALAE